MLKSKLNRKNGLLAKLKYYTLNKLLTTIHNAVFKPHMRYGCQIWTNIHQQSLYSMNLEYYLLMNLSIYKTVVYFKMSSIMKYPKPYKIFSKILVINPITEPERYTIRNLIYTKLEPLIMDSSQ